MIPKLVHWKGHPDKAAWLVDPETSVDWHTNDGRKVFLRCISIGRLRPREFSWNGEQPQPWPGYLVYHPDLIETKSPMLRGIYHDAALALLRMPLVDATIDIGRSKLSMSGLAHGFDLWRFLGAWLWSYWQECDRRGDRWTLKRRWENMKSWGYPHTEGAFRRMMIDLGLFVTNSTPNP